jgi:hypothetical protein
MSDKNPRNKTEKKKMSVFPAKVVPVSHAAIAASDCCLHIPHTTVLPPLARLALPPSHKTSHRRQPVPPTSPAPRCVCRPYGVFRVLRPRHALRCYRHRHHTDYRHSCRHRFLRRLLPEEDPFDLSSNPVRFLAIINSLNNM